MLRPCRRPPPPLVHSRRSRDPERPARLQDVCARWPRDPTPSDAPLRSITPRPIRPSTASVQRDEERLASAGWLGRHAVHPAIRRSELWNTQHVERQPLGRIGVTRLAVLAGPPPDHLDGGHHLADRHGPPQPGARAGWAVGSSPRPTARNPLPKRHPDALRPAPRPDSSTLDSQSRRTYSGALPALPPRA